MRRTAQPKSQDGWLAGSFPGGMLRHPASQSGSWHCIPRSERPSSSVCVPAEEEEHPTCPPEAVVLGAYIRSLCSSSFHSHIFPFMPSACIRICHDHAMPSSAVRTTIRDHPSPLCFIAFKASQNAMTILLSGGECSSLLPLRSCRLALVPVAAGSGEGLSNPATARYGAAQLRHALLSLTSLMSVVGCHRPPAFVSLGGTRNTTVE